MPSEVKKFRQLDEDENTRLRKVVADLTLDKEMLQEVIRRKPYDACSGMRDDRLRAYSVPGVDPQSLPNSSGMPAAPATLRARARRVGGNTTRPPSAVKAKRVRLPQVAQIAPAGRTAARIYRSPSNTAERNENASPVRRKYMIQPRLTPQARVTDNFGAILTE
jgi:hypothetical protein